MSEPKTTDEGTTLKIRMSKEFKNKIKEEAQKRQLSVSAFTRVVLSGYTEVKQTLPENTSL